MKRPDIKKISLRASRWQAIYYTDGRVQRLTTDIGDLTTYIEEQDKRIGRLEEALESLDDGIEYLEILKKMEEDK